MGSDQWKESGDCKQCRKESYCKKLCRAAREAMMRCVYEQIEKQQKAEAEAAQTEEQE